MSDDDNQDPKPPVPESADEPNGTTPYYTAPDGRPHIDDIDNDQTNTKTTST